MNYAIELALDAALAECEIYSHVSMGTLIEVLRQHGYVLVPKDLLEEVLVDAIANNSMAGSEYACSAEDSKEFAENYERIERLQEITGLWWPRKSNMNSGISTYWG